ncbi:hypothetical protein N836_16215 [Leptolyngbya sp. Heron Island J]|uniref:hypothetical protein n=1 Tax=Leptolyngbya sp. Heron Island J TaxID=1385935 RepID=UPI0003B97A7A|nr:hypothetical protein [Leptolyngbya sp. Heron Island J]ESA34569.1 hypothetical protein N836_16215 [Leptolyngbya sp. Heron Island J]
MSDERERYTDVSHNIPLDAPEALIVVVGDVVAAQREDTPVRHVEFSQVNR